MSTSYQEYQNYQDTVSENTFRMYGSTQAIIRHVADQLMQGYMKPNEAALQLFALDKTMERLFKERGEKGAYERIWEYFKEFRKA